jgi:hypothetical protein
VGGGFFVAYAQVCAFYYAAAALLHHVVPAVLPVKSVQVEARKEGSVERDALYSLGERLPTMCPRMHAGAWGATPRMGNHQQCLFSAMQPGSRPAQPLEGTLGTAHAATPMPSYPPTRPMAQARSPSRPPCGRLSSGCMRMGGGSCTPARSRPPGT